MGAGPKPLKRQEPQRRRKRWLVALGLFAVLAAGLFARPQLQPWLSAVTARPAYAQPLLPLSSGDVSSDLELPGGPLENWDLFAEQARRDWRVPGLAIAVVQGDQIIKLKGYGSLSRASDRPVTPDTLFSIASLSKAFTAYGVALLADRGALDLDAPVRQFLPEFALADPVASAGATPRDLLTHRTGLPRHDKLWVNNPGLAGSALLQRLPYLKMTAPLRQRYQYNNLMYEVAGLVTERASGVGWDAYMRTRVFDPIGMHRSNTSLEAMLADPDHASGHVDDGAVQLIEARRSDGIGPAGGINASARDMAQWLRLHLNGGKVGERQLISPERLAELHKAVVVSGAEFTEDAADWGYGMGWRVGQYRGQPRLYHGGVLDGFTARISLFPALDLGIVVLANVEDAPLPERLTRHLVDRLAGLEPVDWSGKALAVRDAADRRKLAKSHPPAMTALPEGSAALLAAYAGEFSDPGYGSIQVREQAGRLIATYNNVAMTLDAQGTDRFRSRTVDDMFDKLSFQFRADAFGRITELVVPMEKRVSAIRFVRPPPPELSDISVLSRLAGRYRNGAQIWQLDVAGTGMTLSIDGTSPAPLAPDIELGFTLSKPKPVRLDFLFDRSGTPTALRAHSADGSAIMMRERPLAQALTKAQAR